METLSSPCANRTENFLSVNELRLYIIDVCKTSVWLSVPLSISTHLGMQTDKRTDCSTNMAASKLRLVNQDGMTDNYNSRSFTLWWICCKFLLVPSFHPSQLTHTLCFFLSLAEVVLIQIILKLKESNTFFMIKLDFITTCKHHSCTSHKLTLNFLFFGFLNVFFKPLIYI